jgi:hypothetical protein
VPPDLVRFQGAECLYLIATLGIVDELGGREQFSDSSIADKDEDGFKEFIDGWGNPISFLRSAPGFPSEYNTVVSGLQVAGSSSTSSIQTIPTPGLSTNDGTYNRFAILFTTGDLIGMAATIDMYIGSSPTFNLLQPGGNPQLPSAPASGDKFNIVDADPFDPAHVYPNASQREATFAVYPLIYSYGPDGIPDLQSDLRAAPLRYAVINNNPFVMIGSSIKTLVGTPADDDNDMSIDTTDNITNHQLITK